MARAVAGEGDPGSIRRPGRVEVGRDLVDGTVKRLTTNVAADFHPTWSANGARIAFSSYRSGHSQIWTVSSTGGTQVRITQTTTEESQPAWSH